MTMNTTSSINSGTGALATKPQAFYDKVLLETRRQRSFYHEKLAQKRKMPRKHGDTIQWRRFGSLEPNLTPLTEGVTPEGKSAEISAISKSTKQYGDFMLFTDVVDFVQVDDTLKHYTLELGHQSSETLDLIVRDELLGQGSKAYAGAVNSADELTAGHKPTVDDFRKITLSMKMNHIAPALNGKYVVFVSPAVMEDILNDPRVRDMMQFGNTNKPIMQNEVVEIYNMKFIEAVNSEIKANTEGENVHSSIVLGKEAYGTVAIEKEGDVKTIVKGLGSSGTLDALDQRQSIGWKINAFACAVLDPMAVTVYKSVPTNA